MAGRKRPPPPPADINDWHASPVAAASPDFDRLLHVQFVVRDLGRALARGEDVADDVAALYRAATKREEDKDARRSLMISVAMVAKHDDATWGAISGSGDGQGLTGKVTDRQLADLVIGYLARPPFNLTAAAERLQKYPADVALAVRLWRRGRGRPKRGEPAGSKWAAIATLLRLAGLGTVDEEIIERYWVAHGVDL